MCQEFDSMSRVGQSVDSQVRSLTTTRQRCSTRRGKPRRIVAERAESKPLGPLACARCFWWPARRVASCGTGRGQMARSMAEARRDFTREEILATAERLFTEQGVRATSIGQVAAAAGMTRANLYYYFPSK